MNNQPPMITSSLEAEIAEHDAEMKTLVDQTAPKLSADRVVGYVRAAVLYLAWCYPGRCRSMIWLLDGEPAIPLHTELRASEDTTVATGAVKRLDNIQRDQTRRVKRPGLLEPRRPKPLITPAHNHDLAG